MTRLEYAAPTKSLERVCERKTSSLLAAEI
jgi:hypothetical protein